MTTLPAASLPVLTEPLSTQAIHTLLAGNGLPARWQGQANFVIVETGFGTGERFLATWQAWRTDPARSERLHYIAVEPTGTLAATTEISAELTELAATLRTHWPVRVSGCHRIELDNGRLSLTLLFGETVKMLGQINARADAIFLAPATSDTPSLAIFRALAGLSDSNTRLASNTAPSTVCDELNAAGFSMEAQPGAPDQADSCQGHYRGQRERFHPLADPRVIVVGAGLAGTAIAERLAARGLQIDLLEEQSDPAQGASGNLAGAFRPLPSKDDNRLSRITRAGFLYGLRHLESLRAAGHEVLWAACGVLHLARSADQEIKQKAVANALQWPDDFMSWIDASQATQKAGHTASFGGWWFPQGAWIQPASLCKANLDRAGENVRLHTHTTVARIAHDGALWRAFDANDALIASAPHIVLANAYDARRLADAEWLPLRTARGQVSHLPMAQIAPLGVVVCGQGYITPGIGGHAALGASFVIDDFDLSLREDEHAENLAKLETMLPGFSNTQTSENLNGRVSLRAIAQDRLPLVGQVPAVQQGEGYNLSTLPRQDGLWMLSGFGSRGLVWSSLCAELLAARICGEPLPLERELVDSLDPARFVLSPPSPEQRPTE